MGWWHAKRDGSSLESEATGLVWGDAVADILDEALDEIAYAFKEQFERFPTNGELRSGLEFALLKHPDEAMYLPK